MIYLITRFFKKEALIIFLLSAAIIFAGCASKKADVEKLDEAAVSDAPNLITDIIAADDSESTTVTVRGNRYLTYTSIKQDIPLGILFYFHQTVLDESIQSTYTPESDIITSIETSELTDQEGTTRILISLKKDIPYDVTPDDTGIKISFLKSSDLEETSISATDMTEVKNEAPGAIPAAKAVDSSIPAATRLESIYVSKYEEKIKVNVNADGVIKNYKSFTIKSPARIVFDIYDIKSPFKRQKTVPVNSMWVSKVRHFGYPDKVRVVLDTKKKYLSAFSAYPVDSGFEIHVGKDTVAPVMASSEKVSTPEKAITPEKKAPVPEEKPVTPAEKMKPASAYTKPAWVNRVDFLAKETGKSTVIIGTTHPVNYDMNEVADKLLRIKLFNTKLPKYRRRPLITTRFESAVNRITPFFKPALKNTSIVALELREMVPYTIEQKEDLLLIHFEASSIPPKPFEQANLPSWKKVFAQMDVADWEEEELPSADTTTSIEEPPIEKTSIPPQKTDREEVTGGKTGEVVYTQQDEDPYNIRRMKKTDSFTGKTEYIEGYFGETSKRYSGEKIALDFYETDIKNVFRILKEVSGQNFAIDDNVTGKVTLSFDKPVPWDQVLDLVLKMNQLGKVYEGDIIRVATKETMKQEERQKKERLQERQKAIHLEDLITVFIPVNYTSAKDVADSHLREKPGKDKSKFNPKRGRVSYDDRMNMIIMTDVPDSIKRAKEIIQKLDKVTPQVMIEARVVEVNSDFTSEIGIDWGADIGPWNSPQRISGNLSGDLAMNLPSPSAGVIGFAFTKVNGTPFVLNAQLSALETRGKGKIISSPKILTVDGKTAMIKSGFQYPYFSISDGDVEVLFKDITLSLEVTPMVTPDERILMQIHITKDDVGEFVDSLGSDVPSIIKNEAQTELLVNDQDTIVIGGIVKSTVTSADSGWPGLMNIPLLGWLFRTEGKTEINKELLIFITPRIVQLEQRNTVVE